MTDSSQNKSILKYGSELGLWMGLYMILMSCCLLLSVKAASLLTLLIPLVLGWPVIIRILQVRIWKEAPQYRSFPAMSLAGLWICIFGTLICAAFSAAYITLLEPDFLRLYLQQCLEMAATATAAGADYSAMLTDMQTLLDSGQLPSPMQWIFSMIWLSSISGALFSLITALTIRPNLIKTNA